MMNRFHSWLPVVALFALLGSAVDGADEPSSRLWATSSAKSYADCYPIGNGRLGGMIIGDPQQDFVRVNEDSLWSGNALDRVNPDALGNLAKIQQLIRDGQTIDAQKMAGFTYAGTPVSTRHYEPLGDLQITMDHTSAYSNYKRWLDLADATSGVSYTNDGVNYTREYFASNPDGILAVKLTASIPGMISFNVHVQKGQNLNRFENWSKGYPGNRVAMGGGTQGIEFAAGAAITAKTGKVYVLGDTVICEGADEAWVYFQAWTTVRKTDPEAAVLGDLAAISTRKFEDVRKAHVRDYQKLYDRAHLSFGPSSNKQKSLETAARFTELKETRTFDPELSSLLFQFGRYLLISSSRSNTLPANLQGLWTASLDPEWGAKYTLNINLEMNYWPSIVTNLIETTGPLYDLIETIRRSGSRTAKSMFGVDGWVVHHNTDMWGDTAPQDNWFDSTWYPTSGAWLSTHLMEHYRYTGDVRFLEQKYNTIKECALFFTKFLTDYKGWKVVNPTLSPENDFYIPGTQTKGAITLGPTVDNSMLRELFDIVSAASAILKGDHKFAADAMATRAKLPPLQTTSYGGIREWIHDYNETNPAHRHYSNLWGVFPGNEITSANKDHFSAASISLSRRFDHGSGTTGWSNAWLIPLGARLFNETIVADSLWNLMTRYTFNTSMLGVGGAEFQVDSSMGVTGALVETLLQSHELVKPKDRGKGGFLSLTSSSTDGNYVLRLLPMLPKAWVGSTGGHVTGLRARGGLTVDIYWNGKGALEKATLVADHDVDVYVTVGQGSLVDNALAGQKIRLNGSQKKETMLLLQARKGQSYTIISG